MAQPAPDNKPGVMERIAVLSVALGITVMILSIAVIMGFKREVAERMTAFAAHVTVTDVSAVHTPDAQPIRRSPHVEELIRHTKGFSSLTPYAVKGGIIRTDDAISQIQLKGVDRTYDWAPFSKWLVEGQLPRIGDTIRTKDLLMSKTLAAKMQFKVGDKVELLFLESDGLTHRDRFKITGLYSSGMEEMDDLNLLTDLRNVQRLSDWPADEVSGYEIRVKNFKQADEFAARLGHTLLYDESDDTQNLTAASLSERYPQIFDWLRAHNVNGAVIILILLTVAFFNLTSALLILVLERTRMIGLLKAMGMPNRPLRGIFLWRALFITLRGLVWGNGIGLVLCLVQKGFHLVKLSSEGYLLSEVPISLDWGWWLGLNAGFAVTIVLLMLIPTYIISTVKPDETIRYE